MNIFHKKILELLKMRNVFIFLCCSFYLFSSALHAEVYKWVDENGKVHFSDKKTTSSAEKVEIKDSTKNQPSQQQGTSNQGIDKQKYLDFLESERQDKKEKKQQQQQELAQQKRRCTNLRDQLQAYEENQSLWYNLNEETGERSYISEEELQKLISDLRTEIKSSC